MMRVVVEFSEALNQRFNVLDPSMGEHMRNQKAPDIGVIRCQNASDFSHQGTFSDANTRAEKAEAAGLHPLEKSILRRVGLKLLKISPCHLV
jgi:hypothetical protein